MLMAGVTPKANGRICEISIAIIWTVLWYSTEHCLTSRRPPCLGTTKNFLYELFPGSCQTGITLRILSMTFIYAVHSRVFYPRTSYMRTDPSRLAENKLVYLRSHVGSTSKHFFISSPCMAWLTPKQ